MRKEKSICKLLPTSQNSDTETSESDGKYCESSTSDEEFQDDQKNCSDAVISSTSKSPYEILRDNNIARNSKELSRIFGLPESKTSMQPTKRNCVGKAKTKKKNLVQEDVQNDNCFESDLDLHYRDLTVDELSKIDNEIKENIGNEFIEYVIFLKCILNSL